MLYQHCCSESQHFLVCTWSYKSKHTTVLAMHLHKTNEGGNHLSMAFCLGIFYWLDWTTGSCWTAKIIQCEQHLATCRQRVSGPIGNLNCTAFCMALAIAGYTAWDSRFTNHGLWFIQWIAANLEHSVWHNSQILCLLVNWTIDHERAYKGYLWCSGLYLLLRFASFCAGITVLAIGKTLSQCYVTHIAGDW